MTLFRTTKQNVSLHIINILNEKELNDSTVKEILTVRREGSREVNRKIIYKKYPLVNLVDI